ncbi:MAG: fluoride efflux transporter CrcB [Nitrospiria bacterium]
MNHYIPLILIAVGAATGAWLRFGLSLWLNPVFPTVPLGTLASNLIGGFLMGVMMDLIEINSFISIQPEMRLGIITGFLGGLTTFSTFSGETVSLFAEGEYVWGGILIFSHLAGSLGMTLFGLMAFNWILSYSSSL